VEVLESECSLKNFLDREVTTSPSATPEKVSIDMRVALIGNIPTHIWTDKKCPVSSFRPSTSADIQMGIPAKIFNVSGASLPILVTTFLSFRPDASYNEHCEINFGEF
jgi:hypothetical protein